MSPRDTLVAMQAEEALKGLIEDYYSKIDQITSMGVGRDPMITIYEAMDLAKIYADAPTGEREVLERTIGGDSVDPAPGLREFAKDLYCELMEHNLTAIARAVKPAMTWDE